MKRIFLTTVLLLLAVSEIKAFDRGLGNPKSVFIPKGSVAVSLSGGYNNWKANGESNEQGVLLAGLVSEVNGNVSLMNVSAAVSWFCADNLSLGARFGYGNTGLDLNHMEMLSLLQLSNRHIARETYTASVALRQYLPLFNSRIFALFFEGRLSGGFGYNKSFAVTERGKEGSYSDLYNLALGLYPGATVFATNSIAFEVSLPILEGVLEWDNQIKGQAHESSLTRKSINYKPSLLGINLGIVYHF